MVSFVFGGSRRKGCGGWVMVELWIGWGKRARKNIYAASPRVVSSFNTHAIFFAVMKTQATHDCRLDSKN